MSIFQVSLKQQLLGQEVRNIFYYETQVGDPSTSEWQDIVDEIRGDYVTYLQAALVTLWNFYAIDYRKVDVAGLPGFQALPTAGTVVGLAALDPLPSQIAMLLAVKAAVTKPNHARSYLCGFTDNHVVAGLFIPGATSVAEDFIDEMTGLNAGGTNPLQRVAAQWNTSHTMVTVTNNIAGSASKASEVPATQRRRRLGVGI